jgi:hypothetical protein
MSCGRLSFNLKLDRLIKTRFGHTLVECVFSVVTFTAEGGTGFWVRDVLFDVNRPLTSSINPRFDSGSGV